jgi:YD repeat-containing protein
MRGLFSLRSLLNKLSSIIITQQLHNYQFAKQRDFMKNLIQAATLTLLLCSTLGCEEEVNRPKDTTFYNLYGPVESVVQSADYSNKPDKDDRQIQGTLKMEFNEQGMALSILQQYVDQSAPDAKPKISSTTFNYDDKGRLESQVHNFDFGSGQKIQYLYKDDSIHPYAANTISETESQMNIFERDERGNLISSKTVTKDFETVAKYEATYNEKNQPTMYKNTFMKDYKASTSFTYNEDGFISSETHNFDGDKSVLTYEYLKTDDKGNWIKRKTLTENEDGFIIETREISYY